MEQGKELATILSFQSLNVLALCIQPARAMADHVNIQCIMLHACLLVLDSTTTWWNHRFRAEFGFVFNGSFIHDHDLR